MIALVFMGAFGVLALLFYMMNELKWASICLIMIIILLNTYRIDKLEGKTKK